MGPRFPGRHGTGNRAQTTGQGGCLTPTHMLTSESDTGGESSMLGMASCLTTVFLLS